MKSHSNIETIIPTIAIEDIAGELQTSVGKLKKLCKLNHIPYMKVGHAWRFKQENYELLMESLQCRYLYSNENDQNITKSKVKYTSEIGSSQFVKAQDVIRNEMQKK
jgi:hypothetical protein